MVLLDMVMPKKGGGLGSGKLKSYPVTASYMENGNPVVDTRIIVMPEDVAANINTPAGRKYLLDNFTFSSTKCSGFESCENKMK